MSEDRDFLGRWSARKLKARGERAAEPAQPEVAAAESAEAEPAEAAAAEAWPVADVADKTDAELLEELGLPDPDSLVEGDDFKAFMRSSVPARLRNRALRKLWVSDPVLANLDGLIDYGQDFTDAATVMPVLKTAYSVGRGFLRDEPEAPAPAAEAAPGASGEGTAGAPAETTAEEIAHQAAGRPEGLAAPEVDPTASHPSEIAEEASLPQGRMRFRFES